VRSEPALRRRAVCQALMFAAFSAYWTGIAFQLIALRGFTQGQIGLFALVGAVGVVASPIAGRVADRGDRFASGVALGIGVAAMVVALVGAGSIVALGASAILLDIAMTAHQVLGQRELYQLRPDARARINSVYMGSVFAGGASGSALAGVLHTHHGWAGIAAAGIALTSLAFARWAVHRFARV
jgi:predicted MFS family arabinose efflux permease